MKEKQVKLPGPDHPISIERNPARVVVSVAGAAVADTRNALTLREAAYPPVQYIPGEDVDFSQLERTDYATYCPYKGDCNYYSVPAGGKKSVNAVWSYEDPFPAVEQIRGHVAFYPERVDENSRAAPNVKGSTDWIIAPRLRPAFNQRCYNQTKRYSCSPLPWVPNKRTCSRLTNISRSWWWGLVMPDARPLWRLVACG